MYLARRKKVVFYIKDKIGKVRYLDTVKMV